MKMFKVLSAFQHREVANSVFFAIDHVSSVEYTWRFSFQGIWSII